MDFCQLLAERERRWNTRLSLAGLYNCPVLSLTLNIPGPDKNLPGADAALGLLRTELCAAVEAAGGTCVDECQFAGPDGPAWVAAVRMDAMALKHLAVAVEESHFLGRLADADVMDSQGQPVNREHVAGTPNAVEGGAAQGRAPRQCFLCFRPASLCRREGRHSLDELLAVVHRTLRLASENAGQEQACRP
ncbi:MAG: hypothetical protein F8N36_05095 [Desulfovibrio sp.]|uniref:citrate lyase holo-[acyl-carrier protein] synthase n=1 Tax=Desulfovibrio sp. TaxID=885 RepID=UPI00135E99D1|nr:citrate lyase holo-[acyl-carrier protein] synthase [Desulfovibrio sp.]MTJ92225.1 hypothetical protein [Desulfovibrio sp.]